MGSKIRSKNRSPHKGPPLCADKGADAWLASSFACHEISCANNTDPIKKGQGWNPKTSTQCVAQNRKTCSRRRTPFWGPKSGPQNGGRLAFLIAINQGTQFWGPLFGPQNGVRLRLHVLRLMATHCVEVFGFRPCPYLIGSVLLEQDISWQAKLLASHASAPLSAHRGGPLWGLRFLLRILDPALGSAFANFPEPWICWVSSDRGCFQRMSLMWGPRYLEGVCQNMACKFDDGL